MADIPEYVKFTFTSKKDPSTGTFPIADYNKDIRNIVNNAVKSALPSDAFYHVGDKSISKQGKMSVDVYVHKDEATAVSKASRYLVGKMDYIDDTGASIGSKYTVTRARGLPADVVQSLYHIETAPARKEEERKQKEEEKKQKKEEQEDKKAREASSRVLHGAIIKVIAVLTGIADITRRILSAVIDFATQAQKDMIQAHNLGMSYETVRAFRNTEIAHGMREGVLTEGVSDIQSKFGNITKLDEKAIEDLAVVMGGKVKEMVNVALNEQSPEKAMGMVLDTFMEKANAGYNSVGQYVGEQNARRELYSYLLRISPAWAEIFATMQEEQHNINSLFRNQASTFEEWRKLLPTSRGDHTSMEYNVNVTMGEEWGIVKSILEQIKQSIGLALAPQLLTLLRRIADTRVGLSETENRERNIQNELRNTNELERVKEVIADLVIAGDLKGADKYYLQALQQYRDDLIEANKGDKKGNIHYAVLTPEEIRYKAQKLATTEAKSGLGRRLGSGLTDEDIVLNPEATEDILPAVSEIQGVLKSYKAPFDINKEREKYYEGVEADIREEWQPLIDNERRRQEDALQARLKSAEEQARKTVFSDTASPYYYQLGNTIHNAQGDLLSVENGQKARMMATVEQFYGEALQGDTLEDRLRYAEQRGWIYYSAYDKAKNNPKLKLPEINLDYFDYEIEEQARTQKTEEDFLYDLYKRNIKFFKPHILGSRVDEAKRAQEEDNIGAVLNILRQDEDIWLKNVPANVKDGAVTGYNEVSAGGEVTYVLKVDIDGEQREILRAQGMRSVAGVMPFNINVENGKYTISGKTASNSTAGVSASAVVKYLPRQQRTIR